MSALSYMHDQDNGKGVEQSGEAASTRPESDIARENEELSRRVTQLAEADQRKNEFLAILSHELRNPIQAIRTNAWVIAQHCKQLEAQESTAAIERQVSLLSKLLGDLLNVISLSKEADLELEVHDARDLVQEALAATRQSIEKHHHRVVVDLGTEELPVNVDPERMVQAFMNLIENAAKYTDPGGIVTVTAKRVIGQVELRVRDTGIGIAPEDVSSLFELFKRGRSGRVRGAGGLGIGLYIASRTAREHGGRLEVESAGVGLGSEFTMTLPLHHTAPADVLEDEEQPDDEAPSAAGKLTILVVDDNRDAADSLSKLLQAYGHDVWTAYDGLEAVDVAREKRPLVALIDIALPKIDGYQVARRLARDQWGRTMTLIAVTGAGLDDDREKALAAGFRYHLVKPIDHAALEGILARL